MQAWTPDVMLTATTPLVLAQYASCTDIGIDLPLGDDQVGATANVLTKQLGAFRWAHLSDAFGQRPNMRATRVPSCGF